MYEATWWTSKEKRRVYEHHVITKQRTGLFRSCLRVVSLGLHSVATWGCGPSQRNALLPAADGLCLNNLFGFTVEWQLFKIGSGLHTPLDSLLFPFKSFPWDSLNSSIFLMTNYPSIALEMKSTFCLATSLLIYFPSSRVYMYTALNGQWIKMPLFIFFSFALLLIMAIIKPLEAGKYPFFAFQDGLHLCMCVLCGLVHMLNFLFHFFLWYRWFYVSQIIFLTAIWNFIYIYAIHMQLRLCVHIYVYVYIHITYSFTYINAHTHLCIYLSIFTYTHRKVAFFIQNEKSMAGMWNEFYSTSKSEALLCKSMTPQTCFKQKIWWTETGLNYFAQKTWVHTWPIYAHNQLEPLLRCIQEAQPWGWKLRKGILYPDVPKCLLNTHTQNSQIWELIFKRFCGFLRVACIECGLCFHGRQKEGVQFCFL